MIEKKWIMCTSNINYIHGKEEIMGKKYSLSVQFHGWLGLRLATYFPNRGESGSQLPASGTREYQIISKEMRMKVVVSRYTGR